jgi:hypothetical protein
VDVLQPINPFGEIIGFAHFNHGNIVAIELHKSRNLCLLVVPNGEAQQRAGSAAGFPPLERIVGRSR